MSNTDKRALDTSESWTNASVIILDIEGTTTSISFVKDTLFPYVRTNLESYVKEHWAEDEFKAVLEKLIEQAAKDVEDKVEGVVVLEKDLEDTEKAQKDVVASVLWQMDADRKTGALKLIQGHVYRQGYEKGDLKGHVYSDVMPALKKWKGEGKEVYIYSSGSVEAQKLLFKHTTDGDLLQYLAGHFDTEMGPKMEADSYKAIIKKVGKKPEEMVFLTDILKEATAAKEAGLKALLVEREGNAPLTDEDKDMFAVLSTLSSVEEEESPTKKVKVDVPAVVEITDDVEMKDEPAKTEAEVATTKEETKTEEPMVAEAEKKEEEKQVEEEKKVAEEEVKIVEKEDKEKKPADVEPETNGKTPAENGTNGTNGVHDSEEKTNGVKEGEKTNGKSEDTVEEKIKEVSPTKKALIETPAGDAPESEVAAD